MFFIALSVLQTKQGFIRNDLIEVYPQKSNKYDIYSFDQAKNKLLEKETVLVFSLCELAFMHIQQMKLALGFPLVNLAFLLILLDSM